ncbi:MAG: hypothetical protein ABI576_16955 [Flavobacterium sp.]
MITKTTLEKATKFVRNCKSIFSLKNILFKRKNRFTLLFCLVTFISFSQTGGCNATLIVENNGNVRSTPPEGTYYSMILTNKGSSTNTYTLSATNINSSCSNTDGSSSTSNTIINIGFIDSEKNSITEINIDAGQSINFYIHITLPASASVEKWSCNQITATSKNCNNYSVDTVLHTYVINPVND